MWYVAHGMAALTTRELACSLARRCSLGGASEGIAAVCGVRNAVAESDVERNGKGDIAERIVRIGSAQGAARREQAREL
jgi:hypothetical protein